MDVTVITITTISNQGNDHRHSTALRSIFFPGWAGEPICRSTHPGVQCVQAAAAGPEGLRSAPHASSKD